MSEVSNGLEARATRYDGLGWFVLILILVIHTTIYHTSGKAQGLGENKSVRISHENRGEMRVRKKVFLVGLPLSYLLFGTRRAARAVPKVNYQSIPMHAPHAHTRKIIKGSISILVSCRCCPSDMLNINSRY